MLLLLLLVLNRSWIKCFLFCSCRSTRGIYYWFDKRLLCMCVCGSFVFNQKKTEEKAKQRKTKTNKRIWFLSWKKNQKENRRMNSCLLILFGSATKRSTYLFDLERVLWISAGFYLLFVCFDVHSYLPIFALNISIQFVKSSRLG